MTSWGILRVPRKTSNSLKLTLLLHVCRSQQAEGKFGSYWNQIRDITSEVVGSFGNSGDRRIKTSSDISDVQFKELNETEKLFGAVLGSKRGMGFISRQVSFKMKLQFRSDSICSFTFYRFIQFRVAKPIPVSQDEMQGTHPEQVASLPQGQQRETESCRNVGYSVLPREKYRIACQSAINI